MGTMHSAEIRLYPNKGQIEKMEKTLECCRTVYNETLAFCKNAWETERKSYSCFDLMKRLPEMKTIHTEMEEVYAQCLQESVARLDKAFQGFFRRVRNNEEPGYPRFKGVNRCHSFSYPQASGFSFIDGHRIRLGKIGAVKYRGKINELFLNVGAMKTCTVSKKSDKWFAEITFDVDGYQNGTEMFVEKPDIGVDLNIKNLATLSNGICFPNSNVVKEFEKKIAKKQRQIARHEKGSPKRKKYLKHLSNLYKRMNDIRSNETHQISRYLVDNYGMIAFEDLDIQGMIDSTDISAIRKAYYSVAWRELVTRTGYKAEDAGIPFVKVDPAYTSQLCSSCGNIVPKSLDERTHHCDACGLTMDRDVNAAINILNRGRGRRPLSTPSG